LLRNLFNRLKRLLGFGVESSTILVRAVDLALWTEELEGFGPGEVPATTLQHKNFRAEKNSLSFWRFDPGDPEWVEDAILAVVGGFGRLDGIHLVWMPETAVASGVSLRATKGHTCFRQLENKHVDAERLDGRRLSLVAESVSASLSKRVVSKTRDEVLTILVKGIQERRLMNVDNLPKALKDEVRSRLAPSP
jgi:hypothetical protein